MPLMIALTFLTGVVDAASYLKFGHVFVANMTGNLVFLGFALAGAGAVGDHLARRARRVPRRALLSGYLGARNAEHRGRLLRAASVTSSR